jgi:hypothetical protein
MAQRASGFTREPDETYETSAAWPVQLIAPHLRQRHCRHAWDMADGPNSKLARVLCAAGFRTAPARSNCRVDAAKDQHHSNN